MAKRRITLIFIVLIILLAVGLIIDINAGYTAIKFSDFIAVFNGTASKSLTFTLVELRLPRVITALLVGIGLSTSGCLLQSVSRNDLADPEVLGINAGAGFAVAVYVSFFTGSLQNAGIAMPIVAFTGAAVTTAVVYGLAYVKNEGISPNRLVLTGIAVSSAIVSATIVLLLKMRHNEYGFVEGWLSGNIWGASWKNIGMMIPWLAVLLGLALYKSKTLNILTLGSQVAAGLGVSIQKESLILLSIGVGLSSICAAVGGRIVFAGLICPHLARRLVGPKHQILLPASALCGAVLLVISDFISRTILSPNEVSIGIVVAVIGSPYFLYLLAKNR